MESYDLSIAATGLALGFGALVYVPGNLLFRRWVDAYGRRLLVALAMSAAVTVTVLYAARPSVWFTIAAFSRSRFIAGGRTLAGSARGLGLAPELRLGVTGVRTAALQSGYFVGAAVGGARSPRRLRVARRSRSPRCSSAPPSRTSCRRRPAPVTPLP